MELQPASDRFLTLSNVVSLVRLLMTVPIVLTIQADMHVTSFVLCWIAAFTDWLDGRVARATGTVSEWGKVIDPIADKVLVGAIVVMLLFKDRLPVWFVVTVIARDVVIVIGSVIARRYSKAVLPSLMSGKLAVSAIAFAGVMAILDLRTVVFYAMVVACIAMAVSLWDYTKRFYGLLR